MKKNSINIWRQRSRWNVSELYSLKKKLNWKPKYFIDEIIDKLIKKEIF